MCANNDTQSTDKQKEENAYKLLNKYIVVVVCVLLCIFVGVGVCAIIAFSTISGWSIVKMVIIGILVLTMLICATIICKQVISVAKDWCKYLKLKELMSENNKSDKNSH